MPEVFQSFVHLSTARGDYVLIDVQSYRSNCNFDDYRSSNVEIIRIASKQEMCKEKPPRYSHEKLKAMRDPKGHSACSSACTQSKKSGIAASPPSANRLCVINLPGALLSGFVTLV